MSNRKQITPEQGLVNLVHKTFDTYKASLFHGFNTERRARKQCEDSLKLAMCNKLHLRLPKEHESSTSTTSKYRAQAVTKGQLLSIQFRTHPIEHWDSPFTPIEIVVKIKMDRQQKEIEGSVLMLPNKEQPETSDVFSSYPLLLVRATSIVWMEIRTWLERSLDSHITPLNLTPAALSNITEWWASQLFDVPSRANQRILAPEASRLHTTKLELEFSVTEVTDISTINIAISTADVMNTFAAIRASNLTLLDAIQKHVYNSMKLQLATCTLTRVGTPIAQIDISQNKLKIMNNVPKAHAIRLLEDLCEVASTRKL